MGPKGELDTKTNWSTGCRTQDELRLQNLVLSANGYPDRSTAVRELQVAFRMRYVH
jgi:hypothetical protein